MASTFDEIEGKALTVGAKLICPGETTYGDSDTVAERRLLRSATIHRIRSDGSVDVNIEACHGPNLNDWNLRFDIERNVSLLKRNGSVHLSEGFENGEEQVQTSLDSCLFVQACGLQLDNSTDSLLLHVGSAFIFRAISSEMLDSEAPALSVLKLQSLVGLKALEQDYNVIALQVQCLVAHKFIKTTPRHDSTIEPLFGPAPLDK